MKENVDLSIIIVSYNTSGLLKDLILSILNTVTKYSYEIIIVDNVSSDDTVQMVRNNFLKNLEELKLRHQKLTNLFLIINKENYGFSKANNIGIEISKGRFILFLNPDTLVFENTLDGMVDFMEKRKDVGASTCFLRMPNGKLDDAAHRGFPTPWRALCHFSYLSRLIPAKIFTGYNLSFLNMKESHEIDALAGAFMLVRREAGQHAKWWDEDYFFYGEDLDFCYKLKENGWKIFFVPEFEILHYKGASGGIKSISKHLTKANKETREKVINSRFSAMKIFYDKNYKTKYPAVVTSLVLLGIGAKWRLSRILNNI